MLSLNTFQDPAYGNEWVTGGVCDCGVAPTYGAFFVRSRDTGAGPTSVELLWPQSNDWPPEVDFNETLGLATATTATIHWGPNNTQYHSSYNVNMTQWHTWGVVWTPTSITYTVDGTVWASVTSASAQIPNVPMHLALQQQTWCGASPVWACPTTPVSMQINWVAIYTPN
jgi:beta-glucanase (GH16 family)